MGLLFLVERKEGNVFKYQMAMEKKRWCLEHYLVSWAVTSKIRGKSKEVVTIKGSASAFYMEMPDKELESASLHYLD